MDYDPPAPKKTSKDGVKLPSAPQTGTSLKQELAPANPEVEAPSRYDPLGLPLLAHEVARFISELDETTCPGIERLPTRDREVLQRYLAQDYLAPAFAEARAVELRSKSELSLAPSTRQLWFGAIRRLTEASPSADPYAQFSMLTTEDRWGSRSSKYDAKAALQRRASHTVLDGLPAFMREIQHWVIAGIEAEYEERRDRDVAERVRTKLEKRALAYEGWFDAHYSDTFKSTDCRTFNADFLLELARATKHLNDFPPDIHGLKGRQKGLEAKSQPPKKTRRDAPLPSPEDFMERGATPLEANLEVERAIQERRKSAPSASKKQTLSKIADMEWRRRKADPDFDFRTEFWRQTLADPHIDDDKRAAIAVVMTIGCRPVELVKGVQFFVLKAKDTDDHYRLVARITGSKLSDTSFPDEEHPLYKRTAEDEAVLDEYAKNEQVVGFNSKGQEWRLMEIRAQSPEARWLADHVRKQGTQHQNANVDNLSAEEVEVFRGYQREGAGVTHSAVITIPHRFRDEVAAARMTDTVRERRIAQAFTELVARLGSQVFPRMQERITPYVFRHAYSSDMKALGGDPGDRSAALGHVSGRTITRYGSAQHSRNRQHRNRASQCVKIVQAKPVRNTRAANKTYGPKAKASTNTNTRKPR